MRTQAEDSHWEALLWWPKQTNTTGKGQNWAAWLHSPLEMTPHHSQHQALTCALAGGYSRNRICKTRVQVQRVYVGGDPRKPIGEQGSEDRKEGGQSMVVVEPGFTMGHRAWCPAHLIQRLLAPRPGNHPAQKWKLWTQILKWST